MKVLRRFCLAGACALAATFVAGAAAGAAGYPPPTSPKPTPSVSVIVPAVTVSVVVVTPSAAPIPLTCTKSCSGTLQLTETILVKVKQGKKTVLKKETIVLGQTNFSAAAGKKVTANVGLNAAGKLALKNAKKAPVTVTLVEIVKGKSVTKSIKLT